ncbi:transposase [Myxococcota bacterium]
MAARKPSPSKIAVLREHGCLNRRAELVSDELFGTTEFFDPHDLLQVKYEMVRRVRVESQPVSHAARIFGFSRPTVYQTLAAFESGGIAALLSKKPGPRRAHKLSEMVVDFLEQTLADQPDSGTGELVVAVQNHFNLSVHPSSVMRALMRREKKRR